MAESHKGKSKPVRSTSARVAQAEGALKESEERYRRLVELCPDAIVVHSEEKIVYANEAGVALLGASSAAELAGKPIWDVLQPDDYDLVTQRLQQIRQEGSAAQHIPLKLTRLDGQVIDAEVAGATITYQGKPAIQTVMRDISERQRTEKELRASEARYRNLFENANDAIATLTVAGTITSMNRGAELLLGWSREELIGQPYHRVATPEFVALAEERTRRFLAGEELLSIFEGELVRKDGTTVPVEARTRPIRDDQGIPTGFQGIYRDITERRAAELAQREREAYFRALIENASDMIIVLEADGKIRSQSSSAERLFSYRQADVEVKSGFDFVHPEDVPGVMEAFQTLVNTPGKAVSVELRVQHPDGSWRVLDATGTNLLQDPAVQGIVINSRDVTERKQAEEAQRASDERYRNLVEHVPDVIYTLGLDGTLTSLNPAFETITGWTRQQWLGEPFVPILHPDDVPIAMGYLQQALEGKNLPLFTLRVRTAAEDYRTGEFLAVPVRQQGADGEVMSILGVSRDITERKRVEEKLLESQRLQERIADTLPDILYLYDLADQKLVYVNRRILTLLGYPQENFKDTIGPLFADLLHPDDRELFAARSAKFPMAADHEILETDFRVRHANGEWRALRSREQICGRTEEGAPKQILGTAQDVTEHKRLEEQLRTGIIDRRQLGTRLRDLRTSLGLTQAEFGKRFGGFRQRQIFAYETGESDIPLTLLLAIHARGYPLEVVLGTGTTTITEQTVQYFSATYRARLLMRRFIETMAQLLDRDQLTVEAVFEELGIPLKELTTEQRKLVEHLADIDKLVE